MEGNEEPPPMTYADLKNLSCDVSSTQEGSLADRDLPSQDDAIGENSPSLFVALPDLPNEKCETLHGYTEDGEVFKDTDFPDFGTTMKSSGAQKNVDTKLKGKIPVRGCPLPDCTKCTKRPSRHLKQFHKMSQNAATLIVNLLKAHNRNEDRQRKASGRRLDSYKRCAICSKFVTRLDKHYDRAHNMATLPTGDSEEDQSAAMSDEGEEGGDEVVKDSKSEDSEDVEDEDEGDDGNTSRDDDEDYKDNSEDFKINEDASVMLDEFGKWLRTASGGKLSDITNGGYVNGCRRAIASLGGAIDDIKNYDRIGLPGGLMETLETANKSAMTIRVVLYGMQKLIEFLQATKRGIFNAEEATRATTTLKNYGKSLRKEVGIQRQRKKRASQEQVERTLPRMSTYSSTYHYQEARNILQHARGGVGFTQFMHVKQYIITRLILANGHRSGVVTNALMSEYEVAKRVGTSYIINVATHKTACGGEARLAVPIDLWDELAVYVSLRLQRIENRKYLFPTSTGEMMQSNHVSRCLHQALDLATCASTIRKATVVLHRETKATEEEMYDLATQMCHQTSTQRSYYDVRNRDKSAAKVSQGIVARLEKYNVSSSPLCLHFPHVSSL